MDVPDIIVPPCSVLPTSSNSASAPMELGCTHSPCQINAGSVCIRVCLNTKAVCHLDCASTVNWFNSFPYLLPSGLQSYCYKYASTILGGGLSMGEKITPLADGYTTAACRTGPLLTPPPCFVARYFKRSSQNVSHFVKKANIFFFSAISFLLISNIVKEFGVNQLPIDT